MHLPVTLASAGLLGLAPAWALILGGLAGAGLAGLRRDDGRP